MKIKNYIPFALIFLFFACSSTEKIATTENPKEEEIYVFDDIEPDAVELENNTVEKSPIQKFIVQVGAFTTRDKAETFISENQSKISEKMSIIFKEGINLFAVQLPQLNTREEAETLRNKLWQMNNFKDAFIITNDE